MVELKTIICDISNDYVLPPIQSRQLLSMIVQRLNENDAEKVDCMQCRVE